MSFLGPEKHTDIPGIWPVGPVNPEITELALDAAMPTPVGFDDNYISRSALAFSTGQLPSDIMEFLDLLDQNLYEPYHRYSRLHLCAPRYESEYLGMSIMDLLRDGMSEKAYQLVLKDIYTETRVEAV